MPISLPICLAAFLISMVPIEVNAKTLGVIVPTSKEEYEAKWGAQVRSWLIGCNDCKVENFTPYGEKGEFKVAALEAQLLAALKGSDLIYFGLNSRTDEASKNWSEALNQASALEKLVVAPAGRPLDGGASAPLAATALAKKQNVIIIGELNDRERLSPKSYFGPEMLTAIRPPANELIGQGMAPLYFATRLLNVLGKKSANEWMSYLTEKKLKTKKIWPGVEDFL